MGSSPVRLSHRFRQPLLLALVAVVPLVAREAARAAIPATTAQAIPLECRLQEGPWQACRMEVVTVGSRWALVVGGQRWEFRHDGHGTVTMQHGQASWRPVSSRWEDPNSLCWDGVCARGSIPLD